MFLIVRSEAKLNLPSTEFIRRSSPEGRNPARNFLVPPPFVGMSVLIAPYVEP